MFGKHVFTIVVAAVIVIALLLQLFMFQVRENEVAVVLTFGRVADRSLAPGYHFRLPWPVQVVRKFDNRLHVNEGKLVEQYTKDKHSIITMVCVGWKIGEQAKDIKKFNENFGRLSEGVLEQAWAKLDRIIRHKTNATLGKHELRDLVCPDPKLLKYEVIEDSVRQAVSSDARALYGIDVAMLKIKRLELPESVREKVYARMKKEREKEAKGIESEGTTEAANIEDQADSQARQIRSLARKMADAIKAEGEREAAEHYNIAAKHPELAIYLKQIDALRELAKTETTFIVDTNTKPFNILVQEPPQVKVDASK